MNHLKKIFLVLAILILAVSCGKRGEDKASKGVYLLNEAEFLLESRDFNQPKEKILQALAIFDEIIKEYPDKVDFLLYRARAYILLFQNDNALTIERAPERARSLVKIPNTWEYSNYDQTILKAEDDLQHILNLRDSISNKQEASARAMMGNIYRLNVDKAGEADEYYQKAIAATKRWRTELESTKTRLDSHTYDIQRAVKQIELLETARVEVSLLAENWGTALSILEDTMAGQDFKYFSVQFILLENKIAKLFDRLDANKEEEKETRAGKLKRLLNEVRSKKKDDKGLAAYNALELEIMKTEEIITDTKNNLIYRIICYHNLGKSDELSISHGILQSFYPDIDAKLTLSLQQSTQEK
jgi:hypothetical protein